MHSRAFSLGWSHLRRAPRPPSPLPLALCNFVFFSLWHCVNVMLQGAAAADCRGAAPSVQLSPDLQALIQHQHHPAAPSGLLSRCSEPAHAWPALHHAARCQPGLVGREYRPVVPAGAFAPPRLFSPAAACDGTIGSPLAGRLSLTGRCWGNQHHLQFFLASLFPSSYKFGAMLGCRAHPAGLNHRCSCRCWDLKKVLAAPPLMSLGAPSSSMSSSTRCTSDLALLDEPLLEMDPLRDARGAVSPVPSSPLQLLQSGTWGCISKAKMSSAGGL